MTALGGRVQCHTSPAASSGHSPTGRVDITPFNRGMACLRQPARITAATDLEPSRLRRRHGRVPRPAGLARHRDPRWQRSGPGRAHGFVGPDLVAVRRRPGPVAHHIPGAPAGTAGRAAGSAARAADHDRGAVRAARAGMIADWRGGTSSPRRTPLMSPRLHPAVVLAPPDGPHVERGHS